MVNRDKSLRINSTRKEPMKMKTPHTYLILPSCAYSCCSPRWQPQPPHRLPAAPGKRMQPPRWRLYDMDSSYAEVVSGAIVHVPELPDSAGWCGDVPGTSGRNYVQVSADGLVTTARTYWKKGNGYSYSVSEGEDYDYYTVEPGDAEITVTLWKWDLDVDRAWRTTPRFMWIMWWMRTSRQILRRISEWQWDCGGDREVSGAVRLAITDTRVHSAWWSTEAATVGRARTRSSGWQKRMGYDAWTRRANQDAGAGGVVMWMRWWRSAALIMSWRTASLRKGWEWFPPIWWKKRTSCLVHDIWEKRLSISVTGKRPEGEIEIPSRLGGYPDGIGEVGWREKNFTKVVLPDTLEKIGDYAVWRPQQAAGVRSPHRLRQFETRLFKWCADVFNWSDESLSLRKRIMDLYGGWKDTGCGGRKNGWKRYQKCRRWVE